MNNLQLQKIIEYTKTQMKDKTFLTHDFSHVDRVAKNAEWIIKTLKLDDVVDKDLVIAACYLHDLPIMIIKNRFFDTFRKHFLEKRYIQRSLPKVIDDFDISKSEKDTLFKVIINHPFSIPYHRLNRSKDLVSKILQDADSIEYISEIRLDILKMEMKKKYLFIMFLKVISLTYLKFIKRNISKFLNFPELALKIKELETI